MNNPVTWYKVKRAQKAAREYLKSYEELIANPDIPETVKSLMVVLQAPLAAACMAILEVKYKIW